MVVWYLVSHILAHERAANLFLQFVHKRAYLHEVCMQTTDTRSNALGYGVTNQGRRQLKIDGTARHY